MRRHETDVTSLVFGLVFAGVVLLWALVAGDVLDLDDLGYLAPVLLIGAGVVGLVVSLTGGRRREAAARAQAQAELVEAERSAVESRSEVDEVGAAELEPDRPTTIP